MTDIKIRPVKGLWVMRAAGAVLGETRNALELSEGDHAPVIYFPRSDIAMAFLDVSDTKSHCPHKGDATYYNIVTKNMPINDAGWSYDTPLDAVSQIKDHLAFYGDNVTVEQV